MTKQRPQRVFQWLIPILAALLITACAGTGNQRTSGEYLDDSVINTRVKTALVRAPDVSALSINVETYRQVVQLSGFVDNEAIKARAEAVARDVDGVRSVVNNLTVKPDSDNS